MPVAEGMVAPGFEAVAEEFQAILEESPGSGAAFAAFAEGRAVVDLWGGTADREEGTPWREDTLQLVFSGTKGLAAACLLMLVDRGALALDAPVSRYWPEFAAAGKGDVSVAQVVSHMAALPGLRHGFDAVDLLDGERMSGRIAQEAPFWEPGTQLAYHALTFGWLCDGFVRRADGRSVGRFFADEVAGPLGLELWIGLPAELESRVARLERRADYAITYLGEGPEPLLEAVWGSLSRHGLFWNDPAFHHAEIPAANAIGTALRLSGTGRRARRRAAPVGGCRPNRAHGARAWDLRRDPTPLCLRRRVRAADRADEARPVAGCVRAYRLRGLGPRSLARSAGGLLVCDERASTRGRRSPRAAAARCARPVSRRR